MNLLRHLSIFLLLFATQLFAQRGGGGGGGAVTPIASLKTVAVPQPIGLENYVADRTALIGLGKAFFWDMQAGSDGATACASCHFHAGGDHRLQNQLSGAAATFNTTLTPADFPFHQLSNINNNQSAVVRDRRQVTGSAGVFGGSVLSIVPGSPFEIFLPSGSLAFSIGAVQTRQVTARNTPSVINTVFNVRNFWDGRASSVFTGATPFGDSDTARNAWAFDNGQLQPEALRLDRASLASQAVGPALNDVEMSYSGRTWPMLGRKLLNLQPLARQTVASDDSVLGAMASPDGKGLAPDYSYPALIRAAFQSRYWGATTTSDSGFTQMELNFPLYWGLAIQAYEATLVSDDSRVDQFLEGRTTALTALEQQGLRTFQAGNSQCTQCHMGPELTAASYTSVQRRTANPGDPDNAGFFRIGASPLAEDAGLGATDGFGLPLFQPTRAGAATGTFKAPGLRNVELTGPYFHNGSQATLEQVLDFYGRNGDFPAGGNLGPGIGRIRLSQADRTAIVAFLKALTDDRVRYQRAPFDHPSLCVADGHTELAPGVLQTDSTQKGLVAQDRWRSIPATGRSGSTIPLQTFDELLRTGGAATASACQ